MQDYALWDVIENRNSFKLAAQTTTNADGTSTTLIPGPITTEEKVQKKNDMKTRSMASKDCKSAGYLGRKFSRENLNLKFLRSLSSEWNTHVVVWRNKPDLDTMSFDDLYNNFKIVEQEVKGTASSSSSSSSHNMAFVSSLSSSNEVNTAYGVSTANTQVSPASTQVSTASTQVSTASTQVSTANLSDATVYAFLANQPNGSQLVHEDLKQIHEDDLEEMDLKWQLALLSMRTRRFFRKLVERSLSMGVTQLDMTSPRWSVSTATRWDTFQGSAEDLGTKIAGTGIKTALEGLFETLKTQLDDLRIEFNKSKFNLATYKRGLASVEEQLIFYKKNEPEFEGYGPKTSKSVSEDIYNEVREYTDAPLVEELVSNDKLKKKSVFPTVAKIEFVRPKQQEKPVRKPVKYTEMYRLTAITIKRKGWNPGIIIQGPKAVNPARPNSAVVNAVRENQENTVKASACHPQKEDQGYVDSRCSRHMTGNMSYLPDFKEFNRGYVSFGGGDKADESQVLLKVPRKNNMYSVDMKHIIPKESLTCLVAKATLDESMLWHRRLGIKKEFSIARTPQQNGVAERRNMTLIEAVRTMLADSKGRTPALSFMRPFGCHVTILNTLDYLGKFDRKSDEGFFVGYSMNSKDFRVYNIRTRKVVENLHIRFLEDKLIIAYDGPKWLIDIDVLIKSRIMCQLLQNASNDELQSSSNVGKKDDQGVCKESGNDNQERPKNSTQDVNNAGPSINTKPDMFSLGDNATLEATHADFFGDETEVDMSNITTTYPVPSTPNTRIHKDHSLDHVIGYVQSGVHTRRMTKTTNEQGFISAVYKGKTHEDLNTSIQEELLQFKLQNVWVLVDWPKGKRAIEEGIDYDEVFALVARIEAIRPFLAYASFIGFIVYQLDVKSSFLYGRIEEERKERSDLIYQEATRGYFACTGLKIKQKEDGIFISQDKYVADILWKFSFTDVRTASTSMDTEKPLLKDSDGDDVDVHLYRSMIRSLMYLTSSRPDIMFAVCACARFQVTPKVSHLHAVKRIFRYLKGQPKLGLWYPRDSSFDLVAYSDSDYAGASLDRKSTTGGCQFLGCRLISWQCKKQTVVATSSTEAEYVAAASCCGQVLWIQNQMLDYGYNFMHTMINIDNNNLLTKALNVGRFQYLVASIGMLNP
ncbi:putative ribonuclease H-like domain-containing protein [Tanacetum coccineum]|uniref:Ribonuclease H-like domain-containing protein n=1 Tax=Tanacetum coccineum TaxID=301880 RepID=A0ABQ5B9P9_9ASTR